MGRWRMEMIVTGKGRRMESAIHTDMAAKEGAVRH